MSRKALLLSVLTLAACAPKAEAPAASAVVLDCQLGFEALSAAIAADPALTAAPPEPGEPYRFFNAKDGRTSFILTADGAPGHPAVLKQSSGGEVTGCPYGDKAGYGEILAYLASLSAARPR